MDIVYLMCEYIEESPNAIAMPMFEETMIETIRDLIDVGEQEEGDLLENALEIFYDTIIPIRSYPDTRILCGKYSPDLLTRMEKCIQYPYCKQRSAEWFETRAYMITASSIHKIFGSEAMQNQLIYEKCKSRKVEKERDEDWCCVGEEEKEEVGHLDNPRHWGEKYEPVSILLYEMEYQTEVGLFGCIPHARYPFLGASPDGINTKMSSPLYGRLVEVKNVVSRVIDGIPLEEYWIQMQIQMEICDLDECDFLETKFTEYTDELESRRDGEFLLSACGDKKGVMLLFLDEHRKPFYLNKPLDMVEYDFILWKRHHIYEYMCKSYTYIRDIYWRLDEMSCVLVCRNMKWFGDNIYNMISFWNTIEDEFVSGFEHRAPKKRVKKEDCVGGGGGAYFTF